MKTSKESYMQIGIHTPELTSANLSKIRQATGLDFEDCSWHNDLTDSINFKFLDGSSLQIFLPNSNEDDNDNELFNHYSVRLWLVNGEIGSDEDKTYSFEELLKFIDLMIESHAAI
jgi:hypothetical protein